MNQEKKYPLEKLKSLIDKSGTILISTHLNADGDAIGSSLAMAMILKEAGKRGICCNPERFSWLFSSG